MDPIRTKPFDKFLILALEERWLRVNQGKPLVFEAKLSMDGKLEFSARLAKLSGNSKEVDTMESQVIL